MEKFLNKERGPTALSASYSDIVYRSMFSSAYGIYIIVPIREKANRFLRSSDHVRSETTNVKASGRGRMRDRLRELTLLIGVHAIRKQSIRIGMRNRVGCRGTRRDSYLSDNIPLDIYARFIRLAVVALDRPVRIV